MSNDIYRRILTALANTYPAPMAGFALLKELSDTDKKIVIQELSHLHELEMVEAAIHMSSDGSMNSTLVKAKITAKGRDYLKPDGGLTAELNTLTIKVHTQTIKDIINAQVELSELESSTKSKLKEAVQNLPAQTLQEVVTGLVQQGLAHSPAAIRWLQTLLS